MNLMSQNISLVNAIVQVTPLNLKNIQVFKELVISISYLGSFNIDVYLITLCSILLLLVVAGYCHILHSRLNY